MAILVRSPPDKNALGAVVIPIFQVDFVAYVLFDLRFTLGVDPDLEPIRGTLGQGSQARASAALNRSGNEDIRNA